MAIVDRRAERNDRERVSAEAGPGLSQADRQERIA